MPVLPVPPSTGHDAAPAPVPVITRQPADALTMVERPAVFTVDVDGAPGSAVTWEQQVSRDAAWTPLTAEDDARFSSDAGTASLTIAGTTARDGIRVRAVVSGAAGPVTSQAATLGVTPLLGPPTSVLAVRGDGGLVIMWAAPSPAEGQLPVTGFLVERVGPAGVERVCAVPADEPLCELSGLSNGTRYEFRIAAMNRAGVGLPATVTAQPSRPVRLTDASARSRRRGRLLLAR